MIVLIWAPRCDYIQTHSSNVLEILDCCGWYLDVQFPILVNYFLIEAGGCVVCSSEWNMIKAAKFCVVSKICQKEQSRTSKKKSTKTTVWTCKCFADYGSFQILYLMSAWKCLKHHWVNTPRIFLIIIELWKQVSDLQIHRILDNLPVAEKRPHTQSPTGQTYDPGYPVGFKASYQKVSILLLRCYHLLSSPCNLSLLLG